MNKAIVIGGFVTALIGVGIAAATTSPIAYGVGEANTQTVGTGIVGGLLAIGGAITSLFQMFKGTGNLKVIEDMLGKFTDSKQTVEIITAEVALVALAGLCIKAGDTANLTKVGELSASMLAKKA